MIQQPRQQQAAGKESRGGVCGGAVEHSPSPPKVPLWAVGSSGSMAVEHRYLQGGSVEYPPSPHKAAPWAACEGGSGAVEHPQALLKHFHGQRCLRETARSLPSRSEHHCRHLLLPGAAADLDASHKQCRHRSASARFLLFCPRRSGRR
uniref:Uncharacterized protein n=1 Tax=Micrurus corallinus TaxID=54390 RepID=A0A2D4FN62_MICCO